MATSPGRSANQTTPKAISATSARKRRTRIISRRRLQRGDGIGGKPPAGVEGFVARLGLGDPGLHWGTSIGGELSELRHRRDDIALRRPLLDARQDRGQVVAAHLLVDRADADELLRVGLQAVEEA